MKSLIKEIHNSLKREAVLSEQYKKILDEIVEIENDLLSKLDDKDKRRII